MATSLPVVLVEGEEYYEDERLKEWRAKDAPWKRIAFGEPDIFWRNKCPECGENANAILEEVTVKRYFDENRESEVFWDASQPHRDDDEGYVTLFCPDGHDWETRELVPGDHFGSNPNLVADPVEPAVPGGFLTALNKARWLATNKGDRDVHATREDLLVAIVEDLEGGIADLQRRAGEDGS